MGNLRDHRTQHSLARVLMRLGVQVTLLAPPGMAMPAAYAGGVVTVESEDNEVVDEILSGSDFVYPLGLVITFERNAAGLIRRVTGMRPGQSAFVIAEDLQTDALGRILGYRQGNGAVITRRHHEDGLFAGQDVSTAGTSAWTWSRHWGAWVFEGKCPRRAYSRPCSLCSGIHAELVTPKWKSQEATEPRKPDTMTQEKQTGGGEPEERAALSLGTLAQGASSALAVLGAATLGLSVLYDYSYLKALGLNFAEVQTTIADHVRSALVWLPTMLAALAFVVLWELFTRRVEGFKSEEEIIGSSKNPTLLRKIRRGPDKALVVFACIFMLQQLLFSTSDSSWYLIFALGWVLVATGAVAHDRMRPRFTLGTALIFVLLPFAAGGIGYLGFTHAERAMKSPAKVWQVTFANEEGGIGESAGVALLRRFSTTAVLVTTEGEVRVVPDASIMGAVRVRQAPTRSIVCTATGFFCSEAAGPAKRQVEPKPTQASPKLN